MKINATATKENFRSTGRKISAWAKANDHDPGTTSQLIHGHIPVPANIETTKSGAIIRDLQRDGLLVTEEEPKQAA